MAHYRAMVDELNAKAKAVEKADTDVVAAMCDISSSPLVDWTVYDSFENAAPGGSLLAVEQAFFDAQGLKTHLNERAVSENTDFNWLQPYEVAWPWRTWVNFARISSARKCPGFPGRVSATVRPSDDDAVRS